MKPSKQNRLTVLFLIGLGFTVILYVLPPFGNISFFGKNLPRENADRQLRSLLSSVQVETQLISDPMAQLIQMPNLPDQVPDPALFPLYGAQPSSNTNDPNITYIEIYSSAEKANGERADERWLIDVAEKFNQQQQRLSSGQIIQVGVRNIPSGLGAQILAAEKGQPAGYSPATNLWLKLLEQEGLQTTAIAPALVPNQAVFAVRSDIYQELRKSGEVTFDRFIDAILAGKVKIAYSNPYIGSSSLNLLYTLFHRTAQPATGQKSLTPADLKSAQVESIYQAFQRQVEQTTPTYLELKQIWMRDPQKFQAIVMAYQSYVTLKQQPGFENLNYIPFGVPENSPLVGFDWNTPQDREALKKFSDFATADPMQQLAKAQGFEPVQSIVNQPPVPSGAFLQAAQSFWKQRKDLGRTVYMELVIDTSGSMNKDNRLKEVQAALRLATQQINQGNQVGLVTFSDRPIRRIQLAPFNTLEQKRLFAAIDQLRPDGETALYDGLAVGLADLMEQQKKDPEGQFYLLLLTDGERTNGIELAQIKDVIKSSGVRIYPVAYGSVNAQELEAIAAIRESSVYEGEPEKVQILFKDLFQTNL